MDEIKKRKEININGCILIQVVVKHQKMYYGEKC
jgi:hypothetical protein